MQSTYYKVGNRRGIVANQRIMPDIAKDKVKSFVQDQKSNQLLRRRPSIKYLNLNVPKQAFGEAEVDLSIMDSVEYTNRRFKYWMQYVDRSTRYVIVEPLKKKDTAAIIEAFKNVLAKLKSKNIPYPKLIVSDPGSEFISQGVISYLKSQGIQSKLLPTKVKSGVVERSIGTIKDALGKHFIDYRTANWIDSIDQIVDRYNDTYHSTIRMTPNQAINNPKKSITNIDKWAAANWNPEPTKFKVGQLVRVRLQTRTFKKGYQPIWSDATYKIDRVIEPEPTSKYRSNRYILDNKDGRFLYNDLLPINQEQTNPFIDSNRGPLGSRLTPIEKASVDKIKATDKNELKGLGVDLEKFDQIRQEGRQLRQRKAVNYEE